VLLAAPAVRADLLSRLRRPLLRRQTHEGQLAGWKRNGGILATVGNDDLSRGVTGALSGMGATEPLAVRSRT
jgi:hypothetical protein